MKKDIQKCIRMTQATFDFIMTFEGNGFNEKFEKACVFFEKELNHLQRQVDHYNELITKQQQHLRSLNDLETQLVKVSRYMKYCEELIEQDMPSFKL